MNEERKIVNALIDSFCFQYFKAIGFLSHKLFQVQVFYLRLTDKCVFNTITSVEMKKTSWKQSNKNIWPRNSIGSSDKIHQIFVQILMSAKNGKKHCFPFLSDALCWLTNCDSVLQYNVQRVSKQEIWNVSLEIQDDILCRSRFKISLFVPLISLDMLAVEKRFVDVSRKLFSYARNDLRKCAAQGNCWMLIISRTHCSSLQTQISYTHVFLCYVTKSFP